MQCPPQQVAPANALGDAEPMDEATRKKRAARQRASAGDKANRKNKKACDADFSGEPRLCKNCGEMKPASEYDEHRATTQIYDSFCKDCRAKSHVDPKRKRGNGMDDVEDEESGNGGASPSKCPRSPGGSPFEGPPGSGALSAGPSADQYTVPNLPYKPISYSV